MKKLSFSQRQGLNPVRVELQADSMDEGLRNKLWNVLQNHVWQLVNLNVSLDGPGNRYIFGILKLIWDQFLEEPLDSMPVYWTKCYAQIRGEYFRFEWYRVYDFVEFIAVDALSNNGTSFKRDCNRLFEEHLSAYRFVGDKIAQITSPQQISSIEKALNQPEPFAAVGVHFQQALDLFTRRPQPDYRNSIKESISAVESLCRMLCGDQSKDFDQALKTLEPKLKFHPAQRQAFAKLFGYTSDAEGIRHALLDAPTLESEDAKFMLISCSAFTNFLVEKAIRAGIIGT
jgi:hypothetical protein